MDGREDARVAGPAPTRAASSSTSSA
jgi:hypothetical protein